MRYLLWVPLLLSLGTGGCSGEPAAKEPAKNCISYSFFEVDACKDPWSGEKAGATAKYDIDQASQDLHAMPFPINTRRKSDGSIDLTGFPTPRADGPLSGQQAPLLQRYLDVAQKKLNGFGIAPTIYIPFDRPLEAKQLPSVEETLGTQFFFLIDIDPKSPEYGKHVPLQWKLSGTTRGQQLRENMLMVQPTWGTPLRPNTTYGFVLRRKIRDANNEVLGQPPELASVIDHGLGIKSGDVDARLAPLAQALAPLLAWLDSTYKAKQQLNDKSTTEADPNIIHPHDIAAATVFTTGDPAGELKGIAQWVRDKTQRKPGYGWKKWTKKTNFKLVEARYEGPNFQRGMPPYKKQGGFVFDDKGDPVVQRWEKAMRVAIAVPDKPDQQAVDNKLPVVIYSHGTKGKFDGFASYKVTQMLTAAGLAVIGIDQPMHGPRSDPPLLEDELTTASFNFFNPESSRTVFRQGVLDNVFLLEMIRDGMLDIPAEHSPTGKPFKLDANRLLFFGHSQGGLVGTMLATVEPHFRAFVFSGAGAGLSLTLLLRKDLVPIDKLLQAALQLDDGELSEFHPAVSLIQALVDITDPLSYGRHVFERGPGFTPPHVLLTEGLLDAATPSATSEALGAALRVAIRYPAVHKNAAMKAIETLVIAPPFRNNLQVGQDKVTSVLVQYEKGTHGVIFKNAKATKLAYNFLFRVATEGVPLIE